MGPDQKAHNQSYFSFLIGWRLLLIRVSWKGMIMGMIIIKERLIGRGLKMGMA